MRKTNAISAGLVLAASLLFAAPLSDSQVLGTWVAVQRSKGGLGAMMTFMPGGKLETSFGAVVESWYEIKGDELTEPSGTNAPPTVMRFRIEGNTLHKQSGAGPEVRLFRVGKAGPTPIVGVWRIESQMTAASILDQAKKSGQPIDAQIAQATADLFNNRTVEYTADGLTKFRLPMQKTAGSYDLAAQTFTTGGTTRRFRIENGTLIVSDGKKDQAFVRSDASKEQLKRAGVRYGDTPAELDRAHH